MSSCVKTHEAVGRFNEAVGRFNEAAVFRPREDRRRRRIVGGDRPRVGLDPFRRWRQNGRRPRGRIRRINPILTIPKHPGLTPVIRLCRRCLHCGENRFFDIDGGDAGRCSGEILLSLGDRQRDVVAIAHTALDGIARRHAMAFVVEQPAEKQRLRSRMGIFPARRIAGEGVLRRVEKRAIDVRRMLAGIARLAVVDLAKIHPVLEEIGERSLGEGNSTDGSARR